MRYRMIAALAKLVTAEAGDRSDDYKQQYEVATMFHLKPDR